MFRQYSSVICEASTITDVLKYMSFDTLLAMDLDNSTLRPTHMNDLGSDQWFKALLNRAIGKLLNHDEALRKTVKLNSDVHSLIKVKPVEPETPRIIRLLQELKLLVIAVTARGSELMEATEKQLDDIHVQFSHASIDALHIPISNSNKNVVFRKGVLYCDGANKGECMIALLNMLLIKYSHIILFDDSDRNLQDVMQIMNTHRINFTGLRYNHLDRRVASYQFERSSVTLSQVSTFFSQSTRDIVAELELLDEECVSISVTDREQERRHP